MPEIDLTDLQIAILRAMATDYVRNGKLRIHTVASIRGPHVNGRHRDHARFNTGRAARFTLRKPKNTLPPLGALMGRRQGKR
ncbi:hypothetical protein NVS89_22370 [Ancylobacter sp. MQZ15Z-1]|uniref:Uncharacterized protein n=1 Tax=Ancylobacter mangrovi TaxID=2972472 RepID=A0A9X2T3Y3_9HYPH|nr:hypothetical protein [Ancylobacter mangrovi]MCS0497840.1 hypothetical protein [Ancylobacter mangrovi]